MQLLDLPPEVFHSIMEAYIASTSLQSDLKNLQLVNKFFYQETTRAICTTRRLFIFPNPNPLLTEYLRYSVNSNKIDNYLTHTFDHVTHQLIKYDVSGQKGLGLGGRIQQLRLGISRAAVSIMVEGLFNVLEGDDPTPLQFIQGCDNEPYRVNAHEFRRSMRGEGQASDAPEHVLSVAAYLGNISLVERLLEQRDVDLNTTSNIFGLALRNAALGGHLQIVKLLLEKGADPEGGGFPRNEEDHEEFLRDCAFEVRLPHYDSLPANIHRYESLPTTALEAAAHNSHGEIVHLLLQQEFHISRSSLNYQRAIVFASMRGDADILKTLIRSVNFDPLPEEFPQALWDHTLRCAAYKGQTKIISLLLEKSADVNRMNFDDMNPGYCTPLGLAALNGQHEAILFLLKMGADINSGGTHPIVMAALRGHARTMELLLNLGAEVLPFQSTFLEIAVGDGEDEIVRVYLERGLHLIPGFAEEGKHALKLARSDGHPRVIRVFEEFGITESSF